MRAKRGVLASVLPIACLLATAGWAARAGDRDDAKVREKDFDTEHIFGFSDGSAIGGAGEKELEITTIGSFGKIGGYATASTETSVRYGITDPLRVSFGTLTDAYAVQDVPDLANLHALTFSGLIGEVRVNLVNNDTHPFGVSVSVNPSWRQFDPTSGARTTAYSVPLTLLFDAQLIPSKAYAVVNLVYTPSVSSTPTGSMRESDVTLIAGASYAIAPRMFLGAEIRHETSVPMGSPTAHALFLGPNLYYRVSPTLDVKIAWAAQIPDLAARSLDLDTYQRHQVELLFAYSF